MFFKLNISIKKTIILSLAFVASTTFLFYSDNDTAQAKYYDSPRSDYLVYPTHYCINENCENIPLYNAPGGKIVVKIQGCSSGGIPPGEVCYKLLVKKYLPNSWVQLQVTKSKASERGFGGGKVVEVKTLYTKIKYIQANYNSADGAIIASTGGLNLRKAPNTNSKILATIPYGTLVTLAYDETGKHASTEQWYYVEYVVKGKPLLGYINVKYTR